MKYVILIDGFKKAEIPGNINKDRLTEIVKMYLFNVEYEGWIKVSIVRQEQKEKKKVKK